LLEVSRYLHLNPVRGVVLGQGTPIERRERLREYRWSSYRGYAGLEKMKSFLDSEPMQGVFESYSGRCWKAREYRRWVEEGLIGEIEDPFAAVKWQQVLGGEGFLRKLKDHWNQRVERAKNYGQKRNWSTVGAQQVEYTDYSLLCTAVRDYAVLGSRRIESRRNCGVIPYAQ
jgi:hypothetical protein